MCFIHDLAQLRPNGLTVHIIVTLRTPYVRRITSSYHTDKMVDSPHVRTNNSLPFHSEKFPRRMSGLGSHCVWFKVKYTCPSIVLNLFVQDRCLPCSKLNLSTSIHTRTRTVGARVFFFYGPFVCMRTCLPRSTAAVKLLAVQQQQHRCWHVC